MAAYAKAIVALVLAIATWGITASEDSKYTQTELWGGLMALATAAGVYVVPNKDENKKTEPEPDYVQKALEAQRNWISDTREG